MPKITIIVPVYKAEKYLHKCIQSLVAQTYQDIEVILINDGSPDSSGDICDDYAKQYSIIRVIHRSNQGVGAARNAGLELASGEWVSFMDSDDWASPDMLEVMLTHALTHSSDLSVFGFFVEDASGVQSVNTFQGPEGYKLNPDDKIKLYSNKRFTPEQKKPYKIGFAGAKLYKRSIISENNIKFFTDLQFAEDKLFNCYVIAHASNIVFSTRPVYHCRITRDSLSRRYRTNAEADAITYLTYIKKFGEKYLSKRESAELYTFLSTIHTLEVCKNEFRAEVTPSISSIKRILKREPFHSSIRNARISDFTTVDRVQIILIKLRLMRLYRFLARKEERRRQNKRFTNI